MYTVIDTGKPEVERYQIRYCRGTNANETVNPPLKDGMPEWCSAAHFSTQFFFYITPYNLRQDYERLGQPYIGCSDLLLVHKVNYHWTQCHFEHSHAVYCYV